jgi:hypothetical protein
VASALIAELLALSPARQLAARSAAVIGDPFCVSSVGQVSGLGADRAAASLGELAAADLIRPIEPTTLFAKLGVSSRTETAAAVIRGHLPAHLAGS